MSSAWFSILVALVGEVLVSFVSPEPLMDVGSTGALGALARRYRRATAIASGSTPEAAIGSISCDGTACFALVCDSVERAGVSPRGVVRRL